MTRDTMRGDSTQVPTHREGRTLFLPEPLLSPTQRTAPVLEGYFSSRDTKQVLGDGAEPNYLHTREEQKTRCLENVLWQELVSWSAKRSKKMP